MIVLIYYIFLKVFLYSASFCLSLSIQSLPMRNRNHREHHSQKGALTIPLDVALTLVYIVLADTMQRDALYCLAQLRT